MTEIQQASVEQASSHKDNPQGHLDQETSLDHASRAPRETHKGDSAPSSQKKPFVKWGLMATILIMVIGCGVYWWLTRYDVSTDDAFTAGRAVTIAPHVSGYVVSLEVNDNQFVHKGQVLLRIDPRDYQANYDNAKALLEQAQSQYFASQYSFLVAQKAFPGRLKLAQSQVEAAKAQLFKTQTDYKRQHSIARPATTQQDIDYSKAALDSAKAQLMQAEAQVMIDEPVKANIGNSQSQVSQQKGSLSAAQAQLALTNLNLEWTVVRAPHDGWVSRRNVEQGSFVNTGQALLSIVEPEVWVIANYKETQITHIRPGQKVTIKVDAYPFLKLEGHVDSLQLGTGATFSAFPPENATGNYVKIVQRVPVKILIDKGLDPKLPLALGLSVVPTVDTSTTPK
ncbi:HlyD family secretion protein [Entomobacter blattae]|uniref:Multidrug export protein EmrA n=1 Tax=Entomobacter blattae TaxID=2762277 RepID=A0A7H1NNC2_9PROT|nr:HlyD family secretion protein [Entomobacter blattae]QNT77282.1 Multidrug export protein EmrA [Entomobacter blattae]